MSHQETRSFSDHGRVTRLECPCSLSVVPCPDQIRPVALVQMIERPGCDGELHVANVYPVFG